MADRRLRVILEARDNLSRVVKKAKSELQEFGRGVTKLAQTFGPAFLAAGAAVAKFASDSIALAKEQIRVETQLDTVLRSTGQAAGVSAEEVKKLASELQGLTNFGDEATIAGQNLLLTFTNIGQDVFPRATTTMLDMSAALGTDLRSSAIQLGKALNDPVQGIGALQRVGVSFTESQRETIKTLAETGEVAQAQALILAELERQFGGSAEAAREADGGFIAMQNALGDLQEVIGAALIPTQNAWTDSIRESVEAWTFVLGTAIPAINEVSASLATQAGASLAAASSQEEARAAFADGVKDVDAFQQSLVNSVDSVEDYREAILGATDEHNPLLNRLKLTSDEFEELKQTAKEAGAALKKEGLIAAGAAQMAGEMAIRQRDLNRELKELNQLAEQAAQQTGTMTSRYQGLANAYRTNPVLVEQQRQLEDTREAWVEQQEEQDEVADSLGRSFSQAADRMSSAISGAVNDTISGLAAVDSRFADLLGGDQGQEDQLARRIAALAGDGIFEGFSAEQVAGQIGGNPLFDGLIAAMQGGDSGAVAAEASRLMNENIAGVLAQSSVDSIRAQMEQQNLAQQVNALVAEQLGEEPAAAGFDVAAIAAGDLTGAQVAIGESTVNLDSAYRDFGETAVNAANSTTEALDPLVTKLRTILGLTNDITGGLDNMAGAGSRAGLSQDTAAAMGPPSGI